MPFCKQCKKWMSEGTGKRKKEFCNTTCRSNFWYGKNKKGEEVKVEPQQKQYNTPKLPDNFTHDEPLSFDKLKKEAISIQFKPPKTVNQYMTWKREIENEVEYREFCDDVEANPTLNRKQKDYCKTANQNLL